jgi:hypothetical protein
MRGIYIHTLGKVYIGECGVDGAWCLLGSGALLTWIHSCL